MRTNQILKPEDYVEPTCVLCEPYLARQKHADIQPIPLQRVIDKLDSYLSQRDYESAEKHLTYWLNEAEKGHDK